MRYHELINEAARPLTFQTIARSPRKYLEVIRDVLIGLGENLDDWEHDNDIVAQLREAAATYARHVQKGTMTIYRAMNVDKNWQPAERGVGLFWTYDPKRAYAYFGDHDRSVILEAVVGEADIDFWRTLATEFTALTENEVTLRPSSRVKLLAVRRNEQAVPWAAPLLGQSYFAKP